MKLKSPGRFWLVTGIFWIVLLCMILQTLVEESFRPSGLEVLPTAEVLGSVDQALGRRTDMSTEQFIGYFAQYMNGLPPVMYLIIGNLLGWILAAAYPREVTRSVTEGLFQWVLIAISIIIIVLLPFLGFLHTFMDAWPIPFLVVFMVLYNGGLWAYYKYVYKKSENARLRKKNVGVATLDELVEELQGLRGAYTQYKNIAEQQQTKIGQLEKDVAAARAANGKG